MGDRYMWREDCPKCKEKDAVDCYDAPSCLMWVRTCDKCDWKDDRNYYETEDNVIELLSEDEAKKRRLVWVNGLTNELLKDESPIEKK